MVRYILQRPIMLVGMMGSGKTRLGRMLAKELDVPFVDSDQVIVEKEGMSINDIFADPHKGEVYFRQGEWAAIKNITVQKPLAKIIAVGGGAFMNDNLRAWVRDKNICTVYLDVPPWLLWLRLHDKTDRPLLRGADGLQRFQQLYKQRRPTYLLAEKVITAGLGTKGSNMRRLLSRLVKDGIVMVDDRDPRAVLQPGATRGKKKGQKKG